MDGLMSEDIRIGILVRTRMEKLARDSMQPNGYGGMWKRKDGTGCPMTFNSCLLQESEGIDRLFAEWELC